ncbi:unnamed protein product [Acanthosepion pharaonis]|uniref:Uncharacterized protein n=1 Tax=Acanthosepion pharaonis TaxID=158019 RepID=A0A812EF98_ACAPH|nr:unnamed protein product [Sepia pharaonis]
MPMIRCDLSNDSGTFNRDKREHTGQNEAVHHPVGNPLSKASLVKTDRTEYGSSQNHRMKVVFLSFVWPFFLPFFLSFFLSSFFSFFFVLSCFLPFSIALFFISFFSFFFLSFFLSFFFSLETGIVIFSLTTFRLSLSLCLLFSPFLYSRFYLLFH